LYQQRAVKIVSRYERKLYPSERVFEISMRIAFQAGKNEARIPVNIVIPKRISSAGKRLMSLIS
jgi:hypothetical protein